MEKFDAIEVITRTRGKVDMDSAPESAPAGSPNGSSIFILWGALTAVVYSAEFLLWRFLNLEWAVWLWVLLPAIGLPLMAAILSKAHRREHKRTRASKLVLDYWILAACIIGVGGFVFGFADLYEMVENPLICLLVGIGAYLTGGVLRLRSMKTCGLVGAAIGIGAFLLQGDLWFWQTAAVAAVGIVSLLIPGILHARSAAA